MRLTDSALGALRHAAGLTQREAATRLERHQTVVSDWERGEYPPKEADLAALATLYGCGLEAVSKAVAQDGKRYAKKLSRLRRSA